jgi:hypothetical protein
MTIWDEAPKAAYYASSNAYLAVEAIHAAGKWPADHAAHLARRAEERAQADLLRCIFGPPPFRPAEVDPAWLAFGDAIVPNLAAGIWEDRAFDRMPILADALVDAGCDDEAVLAHLRGPNTHTRGCHVLDAVLGKW